MRYPSAFLDEVRDRVPVSEVVSRKVRLVRDGRIWKGLCCFHKEKSPSLKVDDQRGRYHCFGCGEDGDIFSFVCRALGKTFPEAVEELASDAGLQLPQQTEEERQRAVQWRAKQASNQEQAERYASAKRPIADYLTKRGITEASANLFQIGYNSGSNRLVIPIHDENAQVAGFAKRSLGDEQPKYINTSEEEGFSKGRTVYNHHRIRDAALSGEPLVVVEGYFDVIQAHQAGVAATAIMGTALTETQMLKLWRLSDKPIICFDGDVAGEKAVNRSLDIILPHLKPGRSVAFATMPSGEDPDAYIRRRGASAFKRTVQAARSLADAVWRRVASGVAGNTPEALAGLKTEIRSCMAKVVDTDMREALSDDLFGRLKEMTGRPAVFRSNGRSHHSASLGAFRLAHGVPEGIPLNEAMLVTALATLPDADIDPDRLGGAALDVALALAEGSVPDEITNIIEDARAVLALSGIVMSDASARQFLAGVKGWSYSRSSITRSISSA